MSERLRIVVTGLAATYPFGGVFWDYLQYPLGLLRLGHDVMYLEDTGRWSYDPEAATFVRRGDRNARFLSIVLRVLDARLRDRWFYRDAEGVAHGRSWTEVTSFCRSCDLFINLSASCWMREEYFAARKTVFIDSDPMYTQASVPAYLSGEIDDATRARVDEIRQHDRFFTFALNIGAPDCRVPTQLFDWQPTSQPIVLDRFESERVPVPARRRVLTTVGSWEPAGREIVVGGELYGGKSQEFERFITFPSRSPLELRLALSGMVPKRRLRPHGWKFDDPIAVSRSPWTYRRYLARSLGEWSVAKNAYVASRSGWFSCRTACYLALGVPALVQDTGFGHVIPTGEGLLKFSTLDEATSMAEELAARPRHHAEAALALAHEYFDSRRVLTELIERATEQGTDAA